MVDPDGRVGASPGSVLVDGSLLADGSVLAACFALLAFGLLRGCGLADEVLDRDALEEGGCAGAVARDGSPALGLAPAEPLAPSVGGLQAVVVSRAPTERATSEPATSRRIVTGISFCPNGHRSPTLAASAANVSTKSVRDGS